jgi:hypothetical protein
MGGVPRSPDFPLKKGSWPHRSVLRQGGKAWLERCPQRVGGVWLVSGHTSPGLLSIAYDSRSG